MQVSVNIHEYDTRVIVRALDGISAVHLHQKGSYWATAPVCIFVRDPREIAAWQTLAETAHDLRQRADKLRRLQVGFLGPISASPYASDTLKDTVDNLSFDVWCEENKLDDEAERLDPWPVWMIADLDRGKTTEAGK